MHPYSHGNRGQMTKTSSCFIKLKANGTTKQTVEEKGGNDQQKEEEEKKRGRLGTAAPLSSSLKALFYVCFDCYI